MNSLPASICPRCRRPAPVNDKAPVCWHCKEAIRKQCRQDQERDYLAAWLSTRAGTDGVPVDDSALTVYASDRRAIVRLVGMARALGVDWTRPPAPVRFDDRVAGAVALYFARQGARNRRGRPARREVEYLATQEPVSNLEAS